MNKDNEIHDEFTPIEEKKAYLIPDVYKASSKIKKRFQTKISFHRGYKNGKCAMRFFFDDKIIVTRISKKTDWKKYRALEMYDDRYLGDFGLQRYNTAQKQREQTLEFIVNEIFQNLNFQVEKNPLHPYEPDLIYKKNNSLLIIELKAFHKNTVCAEPQFTQILKYALAGTKLNKNLKKRFLLITSGELIPLKDTGFLQDKMDINAFVKKRYDKLLKHLWNPEYIDDYERRGMYYSYYKNFWKKISKIPLDFNKDHRLEFILENISNLEKLNEFLNVKGEILVGCISSAGLKQILQVLNKGKINKLLKSLQN